MKFEKLGAITKNLDSRRIPLNSEERIAKSKQGLYPYIGANNIVGYIDEYIFDEKILCVAEDGGSWGANQQCAIIYEGKTWVNNHAHVLAENGKASLEYIKNYLNYANLNKYIKGATRGKLNKSVLENIPIPYPTFPDQLHIANILSKAENLIAQRKESIRLLDEFLKSTFLEMFGDPVRNEKGWEINSLSKFGSLKNGLNYTKSESGVDVRCLGVGDFKELSKLTNMNSLQVLNLTSEPNNEYFLKDGDLVFVRSNGNRELVGRCLLVFPKSEKVTFSGFCIRYRIERNGLNPIFISHLFRVPIFRASMLQGGKGANIQNISQQTLEKLKIIVPPIELQTQFAQIVEKTEALKTQYQQSLQELENLYGSLSQKAFRGELSINKNQKAVQV
jgi:type I restriction enzyme S subunit